MSIRFTIHGWSGDAYTQPISAHSSQFISTGTGLDTRLENQIFLLPTIPGVWYHPNSARQQSRTHIP